jgi:hypothetical protein
MEQDSGNAHARQTPISACDHLSERIISFASQVNEPEQWLADGIGQHAQ